ncbi:MAG TPA: hypothetical protein VH111_11315 [Steroidobacteraceae bacterium]|jgi:cytochrome oxidase Cu insertion factor (SCO1/SenC/PrrC family)|nr:hypothetical protein [Steroidobacteraceae bacterium]
MSAAASELRTRNLRTLGALAGLFLLPLAMAFFTYYGTDWRPARRVNHGVLILPPRSLPQTADAPFHGRWSLVYVGGGGCDSSCRESLYVMRQTRLALGKDMTRVGRVLLASSDCCASAFLAREHPGLVVLDASGADARALLGSFPIDSREHTLFVVDPNGNLMMSYDARRDPRGLLEDLKKLLRLSHIG